MRMTNETMTMGIRAAPIIITYAILTGDITQRPTTRDELVGKLHVLKTDFVQ